MAEITPPKLRVNREEARQKIQAQIEEGQQLRDRSINSDDELDKVGMAAENWSKYNTNLLVALFETSAPVDEYSHFHYNQLSRDDIDYLISEHSIRDILGYQVNEYQTEMGGSLNSLESIRDRFELYDEPSGHTSVCLW